MQILIIGGVGSKFTKQFSLEGFEVLSTYFKHKSNFSNECMLDIRDENNVENLFKKLIQTLLFIPQQLHILIYVKQIINWQVLLMLKELRT